MTSTLASLETAPRADAPAEPVAGRDARVAQLVRDHYAFAWRVLRRFGLVPSDADDAAQQVFLVVVARLLDIEPGKERAFLFRTAMHVASKAHRTRRRRPESADDGADDRRAEGPAPDELVDRHRARALLDELLAELPDDLRAVLVLFEIEGLTTSEIADALGIPSGTVASRLRRARAELELRVARRRTRPAPGGSP